MNKADFIIEGLIKRNQDVRINFERLEKEKKKLILQCEDYLFVYKINGEIFYIGDADSMGNGDRFPTNLIPFQDSSPMDEKYFEEYQALNIKDLILTFDLVNRAITVN